MQQAVLLLVFPHLLRLQKLFMKIYAVQSICIMWLQGSDTMFYKTCNSTPKYFLLDYSAISTNKICVNDNNFNIYTNSQNIITATNNLPYKFSSTSRNSNRKFIISKFLMVFFKTQSYIHRVLICWNDIQHHLQYAVYLMEELINVFLQHVML